MKKYIYILAALSMVPTWSLAQSVESDVDAELDQLYAGAESAPAAAPSAQAGITANAPVSGQPIYILNQATPTSSANAQLAQSQSQVQKQPMTVIEASPLTESRAEAIRRARQDAEVATEQRIVEKLERSRMEDEKKRAAVLFGDKFNQMNNNEAPQQVQQVQPVVVQQMPVQQVEEPKENTRDIIREELAAAMKIEEEVVAPAAVESKYVAGVLGIADYPDTNNVKGNYSLGVAFGSKNNGIIVEGSFLYSNYSLTPGGSYNYGYSYGGYGPYSGGYHVPNEVDINQYTGSLAAKVQLFDGVVKPVFGGLVSYSYRDFKWANYGYYGSYGVPDTSASSHAIDIGAIVGADLEFSEKYSLGVDFRYMWNLSSRIDKPANTWMAGPYYGKEIEKLQYYVMSIVGRVNF